VWDIFLVSTLGAAIRLPFFPAFHEFPDSADLGDMLKTMQQCLAGRSFEEASWMLSQRILHFAEGCMICDCAKSSNFRGGCIDTFIYLFNSYLCERLVVLDEMPVFVP
jgi:hypothetical protein